jgi:hypothetical protein
MAYYTALIAEWPSLTGTTEQKLATLNAMTVTGSIPSLGNITGLQFMSCMHWAEYAAQTALVQATLNTLMLMPTISGGSASPFVAPMFTAIGATMPLTGTALAALATAIIQPWWQANGYSAPIDMNDLVAAGGLT